MTPNTVVEKVCPICGETFRTPRGDAARRKTCSYKCAWDLRGRTSVEKRCKQCGEKFKTVPSQVALGFGRFCSRSCRHAFDVAKAATRPSKDRYGRTSRKADKVWALAVKERDGYECRRCRRYDENVHAHHVITRAQAPHLKHDVSNGIALCNSCHSWAHNNPAEAYRLGFLGHGWEAALERKSANVAAALRTPIDDARLREMHATPGYNASRIAEEMGVGRGAVARRMRELGLPSFPPGRPPMSHTELHPDELEPAEDLAPCICGRMSRSVPCYRCELEDDRDAG